MSKIQWFERYKGGSALSADVILFLQQYTESEFCREFSENFTEWPSVDTKLTISKAADMMMNIHAKTMMYAVSLGSGYGGGIFVGAYTTRDEAERVSAELGEGARIHNMLVD